MPEDETLRRRVRALIADSGLNQREFSLAMELDETKLSKALAGRRRFTTAELASIARVAGVDVAWLLRDGAPGGPSHPAAAPGPVTATPGPSVRPSAHDDPDGARKRILDAAWSLIAARGYHQVRVADVAREAGTSSATVHYHFAGLQALLGEALRHNVALAVDRQSAGLAGVADPHERLLELLELQLPDGPVLAPEWSIWMQVWVEAALDAEPAGASSSRALYAQAQDRWYRTVLMTLHDGAAAGVFRAEHLEMRARQLTALVDGLGIGVMTGGSTVAAMRAALHDFLQSTIAAR